MATRVSRALDYLMRANQTVGSKWRAAQVMGQRRVPYKYRRLLRYSHLVGPAIGLGAEAVRLHGTRLSPTKSRKRRRDEDAEYQDGRRIYSVSPSAQKANWVLGKQAQYEEKKAKWKSRLRTALAVNRLALSSLQAADIYQSIKGGRGIPSYASRSAIVRKGWVKRRQRAKRGEYLRKKFKL